MPARDKTGPLGEGPFTGRRGGNPSPHLGRHPGFGGGFGFGHRFPCCPFGFGWPSKKPTKQDLEDHKEELKKLHREELEELDRFIKESE